MLLRLPIAPFVENFGSTDKNQMSSETHIFFEEKIYNTSKTWIFFILNCQQMNINLSSNLKFYFINFSKKKTNSYFQLFWSFKCCVWNTVKNYFIFNNRKVQYKCFLAERRSINVWTHLLKELDLDNRFPSVCNIV